MSIDEKNGSKFESVYKELMSQKVDNQKELIGDFEESKDEKCKEILKLLMKSYKEG